MTRKKIVILLSTYNGELFLNYQLASIMKQDVICDITLVIRDDGSSDKTINIINLWKKKMNIIFFNDGNSLGPARSFWRLLEIAPEADYYAFADQDDEWDGNKLSTAVNALELILEPAVWFSNCRLIDANNRVIAEKMQEEEPVLTIPSQLICGSAQGCSMVFNKRAKEYVLKKKIQIIPMHDLVMMTYMLAVGKVIYDKKPLFSYRIHGNNAYAKEGKSKIGKIKSTLFLWFFRKNEISIFAGQILKDNENYLNTEIKKFLADLSECRRSVRKRISLINSPLIISTNWRGVRSFRIRILIGLI